MNEFLTTQNLAARIMRLLAGLFAYGMAIALMIRGNIGASPWDVFGQGVSRSTGLSFGLCTIIVSAGVLLLWIPLRQRLGMGTIANAVLVGAFADLGLAFIPQPGHIVLQALMFMAGLFLLALATALYIGAGLGPGPRDGLMTGLVRVTGRPVWLIRTGIELIVVVIGFFLGGVVGVGTVAFAAAVGPLTQLTLRWLHVDLHRSPASRRRPTGVKGLRPESGAAGADPKGGGTASSGADPKSAGTAGAGGAGGDRDRPGVGGAGAGATGVRGTGLGNPLQGSAEPGCRGPVCADPVS
ncbi:membrane protein [Paenarthrobacter sp. PH39-S1]|uniref:membrane protein YczE n=1 Tax=Paenarthrobacter sp. PH39-S1 TaxID=3046204 RepID=UPI0024BA688C|nr:membrane protein [Paenarthrobacter sp. PH39-S1]MDJ0356789.1 membrane protein [Paenarthrobacter sp. PH39-S1]